MKHYCAKPLVQLHMHAHIQVLLTVISTSIIFVLGKELDYRRVLEQHTYMQKGYFFTLAYK